MNQQKVHHAIALADATSTERVSDELMMNQKGVRHAIALVDATSTSRFAHELTIKTNRVHHTLNSLAVSRVEKDLDSGKEASAAPSASVSPVAGGASVNTSPNPRIRSTGADTIPSTASNVSKVSGPMTFFSSVGELLEASRAPSDRETSNLRGWGEHCSTVCTCFSLNHSATSG